MDKKSAFDIDAAVAHIASFAASHDIEFIGHSSGGRAWRRTKRVAIRPVKSPVTYAIALHELGHVLGQQSGRCIDTELQAWEWARAHAVVWVRRMEDAKRDALRCYVAWAERKQRRFPERVFITPGHPVYRHLGSN